ncbi:ABC transporter, ATP-binding protein [Nocardioidaceae bacterium Broad-1]|uniref:dipeptide ABC transporter ATP-binding protein n=1 Tax=Nocardioides luteus TaxID=1844 RepID=UPI000202838C|nr:ABC transporter ATP-binding protein [Nocardioides luteus]EGD41839.1 ABC transporter, ATP-binding protein [Nocardioidaceae bacterium Broad-1]MBG6097022.1 peptide/nickel transport system ATP-binding protein [Nocardioides luteus]
MTNTPQPLSAPLLAAESLSVSYGRTQVVTDVSFALSAGSSLALIGESGSGKSTIARSVLRLLPRDLGRASGSVRLSGQEILDLPERRFRPLRGRELGFIPQDPTSSLNQVRTVGSQALEATRLLSGEHSRAERRELVLDTFARVGLDAPRRVFDSYPHQLSGGMLQRVLIGLTIIPEPQLIIADEPTSALDVTIQKRILDLLSGLREERGISLLLITHDLAIAADRTDEIVVLKGGTVQEAGPTRQVFAAPASDYARKLHGDVPALNPDRYAALRDREIPATPSPKIEFREVGKTFTVEGTELRAVSEASFAVAPGTTHALVGESGSGKTTAVRLLLGLEQPTTGEVLVDGETVSHRTHADLRGVRRHLQLVYQNPFTSLDATWRIRHIVREPLDRYRVGTRRERDERVREALSAVGLDEGLLDRRPTNLSGGQRQRVAIARSLVLRPDVVVLDEPTSALDVSVQADILEVLLGLQAELGLTYVFVSHDLAIVRQIAHTVTVMNRGRIVEQGPVDRVLSHPFTDYTRELVAAVPGRDLADHADRIAERTA